MKRLRYISKFLTAFISRFKGIMLIGILLGVVVFILVRFVIPEFFGKNVERIGMTGRYFVDNLPESVVGQVSDGLTKVDTEGDVQPDLAESWDVSNDGKTWTFHLAPNKVWQDGKPVTSETINYQFEDVEIEKPDPQTIVVHLESPFAPLPYVFSKPVFKKGLLGTGEWEVVKLSVTGNIVEKLTMQKANGDRKVIKFYPTEERTKEAYKLGYVDEIVDIIDVSPFDKWDTVQVIETVSPDRYVAVFFNTQDGSLADKSVRQGLSYAINKEGVEKLRAISPINPLSWAFNPQVKTYDYDPDKAKSLLENSFPLKLVTTPALLSLAEQIASDWTAVGIETTVQVTSALPVDYQAFLAIHDIPADPDQYATWHSTQIATNISKYTSPRIDKLLEDGRLEMSRDGRREIYLDFQRFLLEDAPAVFLYHPVSYSVVRK